MTPDELLAFMAEYKLSRRALARRLGVAQSTVSRWAAGKRTPEHGSMVDREIHALQRKLDRERRAARASAGAGEGEQDG